MDDRRARIGFAAVVAAAALLLSIGAGSLPLLDPDESRFARTSVEMARDGDVVVPHFEGRPRLVKPPLLHWLQSSVFRLFGVSERVARLPALLATLGTLLVAGWVARRRFGPEAAPWAAALLATMPLVVALGRLGTLDALLALHVFAAVALDLAAPGAGPSSAGRAAALGGLLGLAFLVKGPVGVVVPLLAMLAGRTATRRELLPGLRPLLYAVAGWCVVVLPWGIAFLRRLGGDRVAGVVRGEALERFFVGVDHVEPVWFFLAVLAAGAFPWAGPLAVGLSRALRRRNDPAAATALYAAAGFLATLVFFSLGRSKLANYLLPAMPLAAIVLTWELGQELERPRERTLAPALLAGSLAAAALGLSLVAVLGRDPLETGLAPLGAAIHAAGAAGAAVGWRSRRPRLAWGSAAVASAVFLAATATLLMPSLAERRSAAGLVRAVPALADTARPLVVVDMKVPSLAFYLDRVAEEVPVAALGERLAAPDDPVLVFDEDDLAAADPRSLERLDPVGRAGKYVVLEKADPAPPPAELDLPGGPG